MPVCVCVCVCACVWPSPLCVSVVCLPQIHEFDEFALRPMPSHEGKLAFDEIIEIVSGLRVLCKQVLHRTPSPPLFLSTFSYRAHNSIYLLGSSHCGLSACAVISVIGHAYAAGDDGGCSRSSEQ